MLTDKACDSVWGDINTVYQSQERKTRTGYPTQKPLALLSRIIQASSNEGDLVLDPFCGCATTCVAAEAEHRKWVGIDVSPVAHDLIKQRLRRDLGLTDQLIVHRDKPPTRATQKPPKNIRHILFGQQEALCSGCGYQFPFRNFTLDHIVPRSLGGGDEQENLQLLCGACNSKKGNRPMEYLILELKREGIRK